MSFLKGIGGAIGSLSPQQRAMLLRTAAATTRSPMAAKGLMTQAQAVDQAAAQERDRKMREAAQARQFAQQKQLQDERLAAQRQQHQETLKRGQPVGDPFQKGSFLTSGIWDQNSVAEAKKARDAGDPYWESKLVRVDDKGWTTTDAKQLDAALTAANEADANIAGYDNIGKQLLALGSDFQEGWLGQGLAGLRKALGEQSDLDTLRRRFDQLRTQSIMASLPPGAASDTDVKLASSGFPDSFEDREELYAFTQGMAKMSVIDSVYQGYKARVLANKGNLREFDTLWRLNGRELINDRFNQLGYQINTTGKGVYSDVVESAWGAKAENQTQDSQWTVGQTYTDASGVSAIYRGKDANGNDMWEEEPDTGGGW